jgi:hypothetical protein
MKLSLKSVSLLFISLSFSVCCFGQNKCCDSTLVNAKAIRQKAIELYNEYIKLSNNNAFKYVSKEYGKKDSSISYEYEFNGKNEFSSISTKQKVNEKLYIETDYWFLHNQILHIFITYNRKNWLGKWRDNRYGFYEIWDNQLLEMVEKGIPHQNIEPLVNKSYYYKQKGEELAKTSN